MDTSSYTLLDFGNGKRLEQWGEFRLVRPDPTAFGLPADTESFAAADAEYQGEKGKGSWVVRTTVPAEFGVTFDDLTLRARLAPYKHTGIFPEQLQNWRWARECAKKSGRSLTVLHLFAYTGGMTTALAKDGHFVTHVDASKPAITWAKENAVLNDLGADRVRWILDDVPTFVARERKRGKKYDAIVLDPPAFGHSPTGKTWRVERDLKPLLEDCAALLSDAPVFLILNGYAHADTPDSFHRLLTGILKTANPLREVSIVTKELFLKAADGRTLSTGIVARCGF